VVLALGRLSRNGLLRRVSTAYIELFRSIPLLLLIYAFLLALPRYGINLPILWKLVVPIVLVNVAVLAEIFRAGILAVDRGQYEAAAALGLREGTAMRSVILPQAIRLVVPTLVTQLVALLKDSTLGYVVSYPELLKQANNLTVFTHLLVQTYLIVAAVYVVVNLLLSRFAVWLERRLGTRTGGRAAAGAQAAEPEGVPQTMA
jgi:glutamate transport system permease protein